MKWGVRNKTVGKKGKNRDFQVVGFLLYAPYPIFSFFYSKNMNKLYVV